MVLCCRFRARELVAVVTDDQKAEFPKRGGGKAKGEKRQAKGAKKGGKKK